MDGIKTVSDSKFEKKSAPVEDKRPNVMIAIPLYQFIPSYFFFCFMDFLIHITKHNRYNIHFSLNDSQPLDKKRTEIVEEALRLKCDYIFWIDSDMGFPNNALDNMMVHAMKGHKIISGLNFTKSPPFKPVIKVWNDEGIRDVLLYPENQLIEVDGVGMACCLISTDVYKKMTYPYYRFLLKEKKAVNGTMQRFWLAEDLFFCMKAQDLGFKVMVDTGIKTRHIGGHGVGEDTYMAYKEGFKHVIKAIDKLGLRMDMTSKGVPDQKMAKEIVDEAQKLGKEEAKQSKM